MSKQLTDSELFELLKQNQEVVPDSTPTDKISQFILTFGLQEGTSKIPLKLLYLLYKAWSNENLPQGSFETKLMLLMPNKQKIDGTIVFLLNKDTLKLNSELYKLITKDSKNKLNNHVYKKHFDFFLKSCIIKAGSDWISSEVLYSTYLSWLAQGKKSKNLGVDSFKAMCKLYFTTRDSTDKLEVAINLIEFSNARAEKAPEEEKPPRKR